MLQYLNQCSRGRGAWLLMALTAFILELVALWFQHVMLLQPCVMCIYERCALFGIMGAGLVGAIAPKTPLRYVAMLIWLYSAVRGLQLAWEHTMIQLHPSPFQTCDFAARFPVQTTPQFAELARPQHGRDFVPPPENRPHPQRPNLAPEVQTAFLRRLDFCRLESHYGFSIPLFSLGDNKQSKAQMKFSYSRRLHSPEYT